MKSLYCLTSLLIILLINGCATSEITTAWKAKETPNSYKKILVLCLVRDVDRSMQEKMENHFVGDLKNIGYDAITSLQEYGPKAFFNMTEEAALSKLKNSQVDAVITIVLLDKHKEREYVKGNIHYTPYSISYDRFWGYRSILYSRIDEPEYYIQDTKYFWESNLYEMNKQKLVYSVQTASFTPENTESMAHEYGKLIVKNMIKQGVLTKNK